MFDTLLESRPTRARSSGGAVASTLVHAALIALAAYGTSSTVARLERPRVEHVVFTPTPTRAPEPAPPETREIAQAHVDAPSLPRRIDLLISPAVIPTTLPDIDPAAAVTREEDFASATARAGDGGDITGGLVDGHVDASRTFLGSQVDRIAAVAPGNRPPRYPELLRGSRIEGTVVAQFVVTADGRADLSTFVAIESPATLFTDAVRDALRTMRFRAAEVGGRKVRQLVRLPFEFSLQ